MDISRASNFERFVFDAVERDPAAVRALWKDLAEKGEFRIEGEAWKRIQASGFCAGRSTHADRLATIRDLYERLGVLIDPHTADGLKVAREKRIPGVKCLCLETALPAKFAATIREAVGIEPPVPESCKGLEARPQKFEVIEADTELVKWFLDAHIEKKAA